MLLRQRGRKYSSVAEFEDEFFTVQAVRTIHPTQGIRRRALRVGRRMQGGPDTRTQLWGTSAGVFLAGASPEQARQWATQQAARVGGTVTEVENHGRGRPHIHVVMPGNIRSGHIYWGDAPDGDFFDYPY